MPADIFSVLKCILVSACLQASTYTFHPSLEAAKGSSLEATSQVDAVIGSGKLKPFLTSYIICMIFK